jgi:hypothetical protein
MQSDMLVVIDRAGLCCSALMGRNSPWQAGGLGGEPAQPTSTQTNAKENS